MATFITLSKHIDAPCDRVFEKLSDFPRAPEFIKGIKKVEMLTNGAIGVGTRFKETRVMFGREASETMEVTAFDPPRGYTLGCTSCGCKYESEFRLTPQGAGTDVAMRFEAVPLTLFAKIMGFLMKPMMKSCLKEIGKDLEDVKTAIEGTSPAAVS